MRAQRRPVCIRCALVALLVAFWLEGLANAQPVTDTGPTVCATVTRLEGASASARSTRTQRPLVAGETLNAGSILQTGDATKVELTFVDRGVVRLDKDSSIELGVDTGSAGKQVDRFQVRLLKGRMWVTLPDPPESRNSLEILVAGALLVGGEGVFRTELFPDGAAEMKVYSGYVTASGTFVFARKNSRFLLQPAGGEETRNTAPWRYRIESYRKIIIRASGEETKPFRFTAKADLSAWVRWNQRRDAENK
jgi:FecR protein